MLKLTPGVAPVVLFISDLVIFPVNFSSRTVIINGCTAWDGHGASEDVKHVEQQRTKWFNRYTGKVTSWHFFAYIHTTCLDGDEIGPEGVERFCADLEVAPEDVGHFLPWNPVLIVQLDCYVGGCLAHES